MGNHIFEADTPTACPTASRKRRAVVFGGGIGIFPPLMQCFHEDFEVVATLHPRVSPPYEWWLRLLSVRWPRNAWYRKWRYYVEKTPRVFRMMTRDASRQLDALEGHFDVILFFGAMFSPGSRDDRPLFVFTDSCRWLSSRNPHDDISHFANPSEEAKFLLLEGNVYRSATRVFVGSHFVRDALLSHYRVSPDKVVVCGFGAGADFGEPYDKVFDGKTILYIGKGDFEKKGGTLLMQAFEKVRKVLPEAQLHIVGQDRLATAPGVVNHGFVRDREQIVRLMRAAHVFALPSLIDRNPISILEAMASATPCVASDYGAMPELVGDAGIVSPCNDLEALVAALLLILRDETLARGLGERGRRRFCEKYNWERVRRVIRGEIQVALL